MSFAIKHRFREDTLYVSESSKTIKEALLGALASGADLVDADLRGADLIGANLRGANLGGADLTGAYLRGADLIGADLGGAYLRGANLRDAYLGGADLRGAYLRGANLRDANLRGADLRGADLGGAYLTGAYLRGADLGSADLRGVDLIFRLPCADSRGYNQYGCGTSGEWLMHCGCHTFTAEQAKKHYSSAFYPDKDLGRHYIEVTIPYFEKRVAELEHLDNVASGIAAES